MKIYSLTCLLFGIWYIAILQPVPCIADSPGIIWGASTNGLRLGVKISRADILTKPAPNCLIFVENVGTTFLYLRLPEVSGRYRANLEREGRATPRTSVPLSPTARTRWLSVSTNGPVQIDYFSIPECFQISTNGTYSLAVSLKLVSSAVATNVWGNQAKYFWLPPVTNLVQIALPALRK